MKNNSGKYIDTEAIITLYPEIGNTSKLYVPLHFVGGYFEIGREDKINQTGRRAELFEYRDDDNKIDIVEQLASWFSST